jgi:hypothetical protein
LNPRAWFATLGMNIELRRRIQLPRARALNVHERGTADVFLCQIVRAAGNQGAADDE